MRPATLSPAAVKKLQAGLGGQIREQVAEGCSTMHVQIEGWGAATAENVAVREPLVAHVMYE